MPGTHDACLDCCIGSKYRKFALVSAILRDFAVAVDLYRLLGHQAGTILRIADKNFQNMLAIRP